MESVRFKIRCPGCQSQGKAKLEMLNKRVRCKHCDHTFRALPTEGTTGPSAPAAGDRKLRGPASASRPSRDPLRLRVEALEHEVREIRRSLPGPIPRYPDPDPAPAPEAARPGAEATDDLRGQLVRALEAAREAESRQIAQKVADAEKIEELRREVASLRDRAERAEPADVASTSAFEPSAESPIPDNSRPWP